MEEGVAVGCWTILERDVYLKAMFRFQNEGFLVLSKTYYVSAIIWKNKVYLIGEPSIVHFGKQSVHLLS